MTFMRILIVKKIKENLHGTVTLAERLFNYFNENGHPCFLTKYCESKLTDTFKDQQKLLPVSEWNIGKYSQEYKGIGFDVIYCLTTDDAVTGYRLQNRFFKTAKVFTGIYHPNQFMVPTDYFPNYREYLNRKIIRETNPENFIFMDEPCKRSHENYYSTDLSSSPVVPLPMDIKGYELCENYKKDKVVSVGRLTTFKPYPVGVIEAMRSLKAEGNLAFKYYIIGDGSEFSGLKNSIREWGMTEDVILEGTVAYKDINEKIKDAYLFIGMGTTVGEAAGIGLPALVAIDENKDLNYGLLGRIPENILGEKGENIKMLDYKSSLTAFYSLSDQEYREERIQSIKMAGFYKTDNIAKLFLNAFDGGGVQNFKISFFQNLLYILTKIQSRFFIKKTYRYK